MLKKPVMTTNRVLENFLYAHRIRHIKTGKTGDGLTYWVYEETPRLREVFSEFRALYPKGFTPLPNKAVSPIECDAAHAIDHSKGAETECPSITSRTFADT